MKSLFHSTVNRHHTV